VENWIEEEMNTLKVKVCLKNISKTFTPRKKEEVHALQNVSLDIYEGEFLCIIGPSGCGKSTLLYTIAGFEEASAGDVYLDGHKVAKPGPERGLVFQEYALFPWLSVQKNVEFGLRIKKMPPNERRQSAQHYIKLVGLDGFNNKYPHELSGGMRQRCALARCVANHPAVLLMDEPLASVDAMTRITLQEEILKVWGEDSPAKRKTVIYVTHAIDEALFLADRIVAMTPRPGRINRIFEIPFSRPRDEKTREDPRFVSLAKEIWHLFKSFHQ
jgi:NitT/TauT family transport system ATP-binding protein